MVIFFNYQFLGEGRECDLDPTFVKVLLMTHSKRGNSNISQIRTKQQPKFSIPGLLS